MFSVNLKFDENVLHLRHCEVCWGTRLSKTRFLIQAFLQLYSFCIVQMCTYHLGHTFAYLPNGSTQVTWQHVTFLHIMIRVEICRDRHERKSCKICFRCVNFPGKQRDFLHNLGRTTRFTHTNCDFTLKLLIFYALS